MERTTPLEVLAAAYATKRVTHYGAGLTAQMVATKCGLTVPTAIGKLRGLKNAGAVEATDDKPAFWYITDRGLADLKDARKMRERVRP